MQDKNFVQRAVKPLLVTAVVAGVALLVAARAEPTAIKAAAHPAPAVAQRCDAPLDMVRFAHPLARVTRKLAAGEPVTIVAIGSSSTAGAGATSPAASYPSRLAVELQERFPKQSIVVINRGVNGEEVGDMLKRFDAAVIDAKPDLVLWQLGTNSVIRDHTSYDHVGGIREGLRKIRAAGADVVLIDPQFAPKVIAKMDGATKMVTLISTTAKRENVDLFRRFEVMKRWVEVDHMPIETIVAPDGLHLNDWSYACMAKGLSVAISEAVKRPVVSATAAPHLVP
ncbi:MAG TPA: SGNH/GDSL hydrolase family protein [Pseudolabrys sp.]